MPYQTNADVPAAVAKLPEGLQTMWRRVFNSAHETYKGAPDAEGKATATAWAAVNKHREDKGDQVAYDPIALIREIAPLHKRVVVKAKQLSGDQAGQLMKQYELSVGQNRLMLFPRGKFQHPEYGAMTFDDKFFQEIKVNFDNKVLGQTQPFIDVDHEKKNAAAWIHGLSIEPDGLFADVEWTDLGEELVRSKQYKFQSPWWGAFKDPETKKTYDRVLRGGALTNVPFLKVLPAIELWEPGVSSRARDLAWSHSSGREFMLSELSVVPEDQVLGDDSIERTAERVREAYKQQFDTSGMPLYQSYVVEVQDDAVIINVHDSDGMHYFWVPWGEDETDGISFDTESRVEVLEEWVPVEVAEEVEQDEETLAEAITASRELRQKQMACLLADRWHGQNRPWKSDLSAEGGGKASGEKVPRARAARPASGKGASSAFKSRFNSQIREAFVQGRNASPADTVTPDAEASLLRAGRGHEALQESKKSVVKVLTRHGGLVRYDSSELLPSDMAVNRLRHHAIADLVRDGVVEKAKTSTVIVGIKQPIEVEIYRLKKK